MGVLDKFLNAMKLNDEDYDDYDDDFYDEDDDDFFDETPKKKNNRREARDHDFYDEEPSARRSSSAKVTPMRQTKPKIAAGMEVCVIKPTTVEDAREIAETLLANRTVVLNLEGLDVDIAQRIIDFASGSTFAISGNLQKISHYIFIITPKSVDISGDFQDLISGTFDVPPLNNRY